MRFAILQNKFQLTNKIKITHINDNHINFEVSLHFLGIWPTVRRLISKADVIWRVFFFSWISDLSRNKLTELPQECTDYFSLERLVLYHNTIRSIPDSIVYLQSLQFLDLSRNQLSYLPISICELPLQVCYRFFFFRSTFIFVN